MDYDKEKISILAKIKDLCDEIEVKNFSKKIKIVWSNRLTTTVGKASRITYEIILSAKAWPLISQRDRDEIVSHELAHLVALHLFGLKGWGHGNHWRSVMSSFGYRDARQYHRLDSTLAPIRRRVRRYTAHCSCGFAICSRKHFDENKICTSCGKKYDYLIF